MLPRNQHCRTKRLMRSRLPDVFQNKIFLSAGSLIYADKRRDREDDQNAAGV